MERTMERKYDEEWWRGVHVGIRRRCTNKLPATLATLVGYDHGLKGLQPDDSRIGEVVARLRGNGVTIAANRARGREVLPMFPE